ncbi:hypothetical protein jhhlp_007471 [Lomentospora prolificans]|uniref:non-reducing end alpha-L-arabinofuranosidase n=1 Tax=Lomentospora prolificans TaxID=41688 RepID=A0A2N3N148_9PEZI|nr:hypothetical protein jhhlp_007471 [Lomentospora prolificans]
MVLLRTTPAAPSPAVSYVNTLIEQRADPHVIKHTDGWYYFTATVPDYDKIILRKAETIQGLADAPETTIWTRKSSGTGSGQVWAPELHWIDGKWYIYVALGVSGEWRIRAFVLEGTGDDPLTATWVEKGIIKTNWDTFSLDASTFVANGTRYLVWAQLDPTWASEGTSLLLAPLENPWTIKGTGVAISRPDLPWERIGHNVNEGPYVIQRNGAIFLTYSASATDHNYCMGLLTASEGADLMNPASWSKAKEPIFSSNADTNQWGPGHSCFTVSEDGQSDLVVFHDRGYRDINGEPLHDRNRRTRVQKLYWKADGTPDFGIPVADGNTPVRLRLATDPSLYVTARESVWVDSNTQNLADTQFRIVSPGLAGGDNTISLESASKPGQFFNHSGKQLLLGADDKSDAFRAKASFIRHQGLSDKSGISFEASDSPGKFVCVDDENNLTIISEIRDAPQRATFFTE